MHACMSMQGEDESSGSSEGEYSSATGSQSEGSQPKAESEEDGKHVSAKALRCMTTNKAVLQVTGSHAMALHALQELRNGFGLPSGSVRDGAKLSAKLVQSAGASRATPIAAAALDRSCAVNTVWVLPGLTG